MFYVVVCNQNITIMLANMNARHIRTVHQRTLGELIKPDVFQPRTSLANYAPTTLYRIPEHQRFSAWSLSKQQRLVESVLFNLPIHAIIVTKHHDVQLGPDNHHTITEYFNIEDGQTRMTTLQLFFLDKFPTHDNRLYSQLSNDEQTYFLTYQVTIEVFAINGNTADSRDLMANVFERLNAGKSLGDNNKYWARKETPVVSFVLTFVKSDDFRANFSKYIGDVGGGKSRKLLSDIVGAILSIAGSSEATLNTSYERNYAFLTRALTPAGVDNVGAFFHAYFNMLEGVVGTINNRPNKIYGKLSGIFGLAICSWIHYNAIVDAVSWFTVAKYYNNRYEPATFAGLRIGDRRNCQGSAIHKRLEKIIEQWERADRDDEIRNGGGWETTSDDSDDEP